MTNKWFAIQQHTYTHKMHTQIANIVSNEISSQTREKSAPSFSVSFAIAVDFIGKRAF